MRGLDPRTHVFWNQVCLKEDFFCFGLSSKDWTSALEVICRQDVGTRVKPGHDEIFRFNELEIK